MTEVLTYREDGSTFGRRVDHAVAFRAGPCHRLFHQHVNSAPKQVDGNWLMPMVRRRDNREIGEIRNLAVITQRATA